ncbi:MAG: hypothetical protein JO048_15740, partial [Methylobacteriaceae bacterium]|nr:hypothetical protein [Methylobacteriaceae bacterium]
MYFAVQEFGDQLEFWLVPDNPSSEARVIVSAEGGRKRYVFGWNRERPDVRDARLHATGLCGFSINPEVMPEIGTGQPLELYEHDSNLLVYRKPPPDVVERRILH